jgi:hypothetical protein
VLSCDSDWRLDDYLAHDNARERIAQQAHDYVTGELTMTTMVHRVLVAAGRGPSAVAGAGLEGVARAHRA